MLEIHENYIVNDKGETTAVVINIDEYNKIKEILKSLGDIDSIDVNYNIAKGLKDVEDGKVFSIDTLFEDEKDAASI
ncbi:hypothetical protein HBE96_21980 [Clostridium sp. P21]|uniref:Antitoxin n=1 Tax=Clostridium muellerianum TaxID=2716538 RepID=A0A7Y0EKT7_9CLOT|nr:hypothetical protein [Clostridium muellerianum]NMM65257.1 hypothetical protein [Clostridium muellerianum]